MADIKASCANTRCNHDIPDIVFEILNESFSIDLILATVQNNSFVANLEKLLEELVSLDLFIDKDEDASFLLPFTQQLHESEKLVFFFMKLHTLLNILACLTSVADDDFNWLYQYALC